MLTTDLPPHYDDAVDILLATCNGEKFLAHQLDSIIFQTHRNWHLIVADDGSSDGTLEILQNYAAALPGRITLLESGGKRRGACQNFARLLQQATAPYTMFCDQDDAWLPQKTSHTLALAKSLESCSRQGTPVMVHTDLRVVNEALETVHNSFCKFQNIDPVDGERLNRLLMQNVATGCTMMINSALRELAAPVPSQAVMHDWWLTLVAAAVGRIGFLAEPTVLYRQHGSNAIGAKGWSFSAELGLVFSPARHAEARQKSRQLYLTYQSQARALLERFGDRLSARQCKTVDAFINLNDCNILKRKYVMVKHGFFYSNKIVTIGMLLFKWWD